MKTAELTGAALNWAVAKAEGRVLHVPDPATNEDLAKLQVPFQLYGTVCIRHGDRLHWVVEEVTITRFSIDRSVGATAPSVSFTDGQGRLCRGSARLFYLTREAAQLDADQENLGGLEGFEPSTNWEQGGPIIFERKRLSVYPFFIDGRIEGWSACDPHHLEYDENGAFVDGSDHAQDGITALVAGLRCFVASELGDEVNVPSELL